MPYINCVLMLSGSCKCMKQSKQLVMSHAKSKSAALTHGAAMQTTDYAGYIRRAFMDEGLMGVVAKLPLERNFKLEHVKEVDPYHPVALPLRSPHGRPACCRMQHCTPKSTDASPALRTGHTRMDGFVACRL